MKTVKFSALFIFSIGLMCAEDMTVKLLSLTWRGNPEIQIDLQIPLKWEISGTMARDEKSKKRVELSVSEDFNDSEIRGKKIIYKNAYDKEFEIITIMEKNDAETGTGVVSGTVYECYVIHNRKKVQLIHFFDWQGAPSNKKLYIEMMKNIKIRKAR
ncbi:hypothetical protein [Turneriella parva]|uniref:Uncharacterized protein n=1 Tax=Turneriella parva (strain ATCC BAA-1111 / DSM 21527 / NCTC 11395 / H) TaxID=869212 RepID=I4B824_TURPD|nr:hypothetical protein [Turneriella parva]AFM13431.1 hypothetical protein Turpa_2792 [Turneriella parva DSM 21527]